MTKDAISDFSVTANSNTDIIGVNIDEGCPPSSLNNGIRALMKTLADLNAGNSSLGTLKVDNLQLNANAITSTDTNGNITITPHGTGSVVIDGLTHPQADGSSGQLMKTNGSGVLSFVTVAEAFPSGTKMLFNQTAAPTGWTKDATNNNDSALRVVTGTAGTGGSVAFSTAMATPAVAGSVGLTGNLAAGNLAVSMSGNISDTTLSTAQIPSHTHNAAVRFGNSGTAANTTFHAGRNNVQSNGTAATAAAGGGAAHNHAHNLSGSMSGVPGVGNLAGSLSSSTATINVKYVDVIVAAKD